MAKKGSRPKKKPLLVSMCRHCCQKVEFKRIHYTGEGEIWRPYNLDGTRHTKCKGGEWNELGRTEG